MEAAPSSPPNSQAVNDLVSTLHQSLFFSDPPLSPRSPPTSARPSASSAASSAPSSSYASSDEEVEDDDEEDEEVEDHDHPHVVCSYCGVRSTSLVRCVRTGRWFCNGTSPESSASCAVFHLVKSRSNEVALHPTSPLGDATLECYATGVRNVFVLGFVPLRSSPAMVILSRNCSPTSDQIKNLDLDMSVWQPIIQDRAFVPWLIPSPEEHLRRRRVSPAEVKRIFHEDS